MPTPTPTTRHRSSRRPTRPPLASRPRSLSRVRRSACFSFFGPQEPLLSKKYSFDLLGNKIVDASASYLAVNYHSFDLTVRLQETGGIVARQSYGSGEISVPARRVTSYEVIWGSTDRCCGPEAQSLLLACAVGTFVLTRFFFFSPCSFRSRSPVIIPMRTIPLVRNGALLSSTLQNSTQNHWGEVDPLTLYFNACLQTPRSARRARTSTRPSTGRL
jgi:hypothetical protein